MAEVWDDKRWRRSARRWRLGVPAVSAVLGGFALYLHEQDVGPKVPPSVYRSVAGPDVRILHAASEQDAAEQPEYLLVEVGGVGDPVEVLKTTLQQHGWRLVAGWAVFGGSVSPGDGGYHLSWQPPSTFANSDFPLGEYADRSDSRQLLLRIDNPPAWPA